MRDEVTIEVLLSNPADLERSIADIYLVWRDAEQNAGERARPLQQARLEYAAAKETFEQARAAFVEQYGSLGSEGDGEARARLEALHGVLSDKEAKVNDELKALRDSVLQEQFSALFSCVKKNFSVLELVNLLTRLLNIGPERSGMNDVLESHLEVSEEGSAEWNSRFSFYMQLTVMMTHEAIDKLLDKMPADQVRHLKAGLSKIVASNNQLACIFDHDHAAVDQRIDACIAKVDTELRQGGMPGSMQSSLQQYRGHLQAARGVRTISEKYEHIGRAVSQIDRTDLRLVKNKLMRGLLRCFQTICIPYAAYRVYRYAKTGRYMGGVFRLQLNGKVYSRSAHRALHRSMTVIEADSLRAAVEARA